MAVKVLRLVTVYDFNLDAQFVVFRGAACHIGRSDNHIRWTRVIGNHATVYAYLCTVVTQEGRGKTTFQLIVFGIDHCASKGLEHLIIAIHLHVGFVQLAFKEVSVARLDFNAVVESAVWCPIVITRSKNAIVSSCVTYVNIIVKAYHGVVDDVHVVLVRLIRIGKPNYTILYQ